MSTLPDFRQQVATALVNRGFRVRNKHARIYIYRTPAGVENCGWINVTKGRDVDYDGLVRDNGVMRAGAEITKAVIAIKTTYNDGRDAVTVFHS